MSLDAVAWRRRGNECAKLRTPVGYAQAIDCYGEGLKAGATGKSRAQLLSCRAHVRLLIGGIDSAELAVEDCRTALIDDPMDTMIYWRAAKASMRLESREQAIDFCRRGLELAAPNALLSDLLDSIEGVKNLGADSDAQCTHTFGFREESLSDFRQAAVTSFRAAVDVDRNDADAWCGLGVALLHDDKVDESLDALLAAVAANPQHAEAHRNLGDVYLRLGDLTSAESSFLETCRLAPDEITAETCFGLGKPDLYPLALFGGCPPSSCPPIVRMFGPNDSGGIPNTSPKHQSIGKKT